MNSRIQRDVLVGDFGGYLGPLDKYKLTYNQVRKIYAQKGYRFYTGAYNINLGGIRSSSNDVDRFNDVLFVAYEDHFGNGILLLSKATTKPGLGWLKDKMGNRNGTAILVPGYYPSCWTLGKHKGQYEALVQSDKATFKVWRDNDKDGEFDYTGKIYDDVGGLNMHCESLLTETEKVGLYSAGCQVRQYDLEHFMVINLCKLSIIYWGKYISYGLFVESDLSL